MGYVHVEHANYINRKFYGYAAKDFKKLLEDTKTCKCQAAIP